MIKLQKFNKSDCKQLISWVPDDSFLLQWAGPLYTFPLNESQLAETIKQTEGEHPTFFLFKAVDMASHTTIGHIELINIDYEQGRGHIARVLVGSKAHRGKGYGRILMNLIVEFAFKKLGLETLTLGVFDFNQAAISCYQNIGFKPLEYRKNASKFKNEYWHLIVMKLTKKKWESCLK